MLNYIWAALIILGLAAAVYTDVTDKVNNKYLNDNKYNCKIVISEKGVGEIFFAKEIEANDKSFFSEKRFKVSYSSIDSHNLNLTLQVNPSDSKILRDYAAFSGESNDISGQMEIVESSDSLLTGAITLESITLLKIKNVTNAVIDYAGIAVKIAIGLIGVMALWLGIMKIAEEAGIVKLISKIVKPITKFLFPDVPHDHPAIGAIVMNMSANMLGLGNAATPFGLKAMEELNKLNKVKDTATNAMCTFLAINTAGLTLIPATAIAVRASSGSANPTIIIATSIFGALCATTVGIISAKLFEKFTGQSSLTDFLSKNWKLIFAIFVVTAATIITINLGFNTISNFMGSLFDAETLKTVITTISTLAIPVIIAGFVVFGLIKKIKIYEVFVEGAKEGFDVAVRIIPFLVAMLIAIAIFRAGGGMEILIAFISPLTDFIGMPSEALPMALMRPLSGSGSLGIMTETINQFGPDSFIGVLTSTFFGSTETTFYVLAVYFGSVSIKKTRHALIVGLLADVAGILGALFIVKQLFG